MEKSSLEERLAKVLALYYGAKTEGERSAAAAAVRRIKTTIAEDQRAHLKNKKYVYCYNEGRWKWIWKEEASFRQCA